MTLFIPANINTVMKLLDENGFEPYLVGGCVRDTIMDKTPHDYDITANGSPDDIESLFIGHGFKTIPKGREFGTIGILSDGEVVEVTPYRTEGSYSDSRHPDSVCFVSDISLDLSRRDFTINAMAMDINGDILDLYGGKEDIEKGVIRCVGVPEERFGEDALRILRAIRFAARFCFDIEDSTKAAMLALSSGLSNISGERICAELNGALSSPGAFKVLSDCEEIVKSVIPCFKADERLCDSYGDFAYRLFICIKDGGKKAIEDVHSLLKISNFDYDRLTRLTRIFEEDFNRTDDGKIIFDDKVKRLLCTVPSSEVMDIFHFTASDDKSLSEFLENGIYTLKKLALKGGDVVNTGRFDIAETSRVLTAILKMVAVGKLENSLPEIMDFLEKCAVDFYKHE